MRKVLRAIQTFFPYLQDARFSVRLFLIRLTKVPHEEDFNALRKFKPGEDHVYLDIGSNRGEALTSILNVGELKNKIIGFEPNPLIFNKLQNNFIGNSQVEVNNCGIGNVNHELVLYVPFYRKWMFDGLSSLKYEAAESWLKTRLWRFNEKNLSIKSVSCEVHRLDDYKFNPYFIKIDVQGFEYEVLEGGFETLKSSKPILLIESITEEVKELLKPIGYDFYRYHKGNLIPGEGELNTFCMTSERHSEITSTGS